MPIPILFIPAAVAATGGGLSAATFVGSFTLGGAVAYGGYQTAYSLYNGVCDWINPNRIEKLDNQSVENLLKVDDQREEERAQDLDELVDGIQQKSKHFDDQEVWQNTEIQQIVDGVDSDRELIQGQVVKITQINQELEHTAHAQEELIIRLQRELQEKMTAFERTQQQLLEASNKQFEQAAKELTETKIQTEASKSELARIKEELILVVEKNKEKDSKINLIEQKVLNQEKTFKNAISQAQSQIDQLLSEKQIFKNQVKCLTEQLEAAKKEQLEAAKENKQSSPRFFASFFNK